jgi:hypothetical protein
MGILDDAIREHLELKRQHGADESEVEGLEAEAFGPAERPDATAGQSTPADPPGYESEAMTQVISPGSALTVPAGEGDQLDKVFEAKREEQATAEHLAAREPAESTDEPQAEEHDLPEAEAEAPAAPTVSEQPEDEHDQGDGDAGDALEAERQHLAGQPTEHYDVDAAIAEEDEIDLLSESRLADELDRALDGPGETAVPLPPEEPEASGPGASVEPDPDPEPVEAPAADEQAATEPASTGEALEEDDADLDEGEFFDQDDPLEGTPDFLEETPEHDRLWFEQKEPKDFDFGD